jgi:ribose-phosphate pyrophosphokinase
VLNVVGEVGDRDCLIIDDMVDTAGTMCEAARALKRLGAREVYACASHGLLSGPAVDRLTTAPIAEMAITNTIHLPEERRFDRLKVLSIAPLLSQAIRNTHSDQSVSSLFD